MMKSLNIKIPIITAQQMDDNGELNPQYIGVFILRKLQYTEGVLDKPIEGLSYNYTFKIASHLHKQVKLKALENDITMNDLVCRLLGAYYE